MREVGLCHNGYELKILSSVDKYGTIDRDAAHELIAAFIYALVYKYLEGLSQVIWKLPGGQRYGSECFNSFINY